MSKNKILFHTGKKWKHPTLEERGKVRCSEHLWLILASRLVRYWGVSKGKWLFGLIHTDHSEERTYWKPLENAGEEEQKMLDRHSKMDGVSVRTTAKYGVDLEELCREINAFDEAIAAGKSKPFRFDD